jgi:hypothetical protein
MLNMKGSKSDDVLFPSPATKKIIADEQYPSISTAIMKPVFISGYASH